MKTVEDFDRCAPALLSEDARNYYLAASGRRITYTNNLKSFRRYSIIPRNLRDVSNLNLSTTVLGWPIAAPIGLSPVGAMGLANKDGEVGAAKAVSEEGIVMILSSAASDSIEEVAQGVDNNQTVLWMQTYIHVNRANTLQILKRAENAGFKAIVVTVDSPIGGANLCEAKNIFNAFYVPNMIDGKFRITDIDPSLTFHDLAWVIQNTYLPVVAKGILNGEDAKIAALAGASAILVSNHGGRQLDGDPPTIDVLPEIVSALQKCCPGVEVYMDGGVRNGFDVYKSLARGARVVFFGRPSLWGQAIAGEAGVKKVISIFKAELNESMTLAGYSTPSEISPKSVVPGIFPLIQFGREEENE